MICYSIEVMQKSSIGSSILFRAPLFTVIFFLLFPLLFAFVSDCQGLDCIGIGYITIILSPIFGVIAALAISKRPSKVRVTEQPSVTETLISFIISFVALGLIVQVPDVFESLSKQFINPVITGVRRYDFSKDILVTPRKAERSALLVRDNVVIWNEEISDKEDDYSGVDEVFVFSFDPTRRTGNITRLGRGRGTFLDVNGALTVIVYNLDGSVTHFNPRTSERFTTGWIPLPPDSPSRCPDSVISRFDSDILQYSCSGDYVVYIRNSDKTLHLQPVQ